MEKIQITKEWIIRLKEYTENVRKSQGDDRYQAINALLGYLDSLDILINDKFFNSGD
jgi:hypothetical protein